MISREKMIALYSGMVRYRKLVERTGALVAEGALSAEGQPAAGREAMLAGLTADLSRGDMFSVIGNDVVSHFVPGAKAALSFADIRASRNGHSRGAAQGKSSAAGELLAQAIAAAEEIVAKKKDKVAVVVSEQRITAGLWREQLARIRQSNLPAVLVRLTQPGKEKKRRGSRAGDAPRALVAGVPLIAVDAGDVLAVYRVAYESISRARQRRGPTLIECVDFGGALSATTEAEPADPIETMETALFKRRILNAALKQKIAADVARQVNATLRAARN